MKECGRQGRTVGRRTTVTHDCSVRLVRAGLPPKPTVFNFFQPIIGKLTIRSNLNIFGLSRLGLIVTRSATRPTNTEVVNATARKFINHIRVSVPLGVHSNVPARPHPLTKNVLRAYSCLRIISHQPLSSYSAVALICRSVNIHYCFYFPQATFKGLPFPSHYVQVAGYLVCALVD